MRAFIMLLCMVSLASADTINKRIYQISAASLSSLQNKQIGVNTTADANLGFKMWGGKDADGNLTSWLAKDKPARVQSLKTDSLFSTLTTANYVNKATTNGRIINSQIFDNGVTIGINTATPDASLKLDIVGGMRATKGIFNAASGVAFRVQYNGYDAIKNEDWITTMTGGDPDSPVLILNDGHLDVNGGAIKVGNGTREIDYDYNPSGIVMGNDGGIDFTDDYFTNAVTSVLPAHTHGRIKGQGLDDGYHPGGLKITGIGGDESDDNASGLVLQGLKKNNGVYPPAVRIEGYTINGALVDSIANTDPILSVANRDIVKFSVLGDGSIYSNALSGNYLTKANTLGVITESQIYDNGTNIGIGTTSPLAKLSIDGGVHVGGNSDPGDNNLLVDGNATVSLNVYSKDIFYNGVGSLVSISGQWPSIGANFYNDNGVLKYTTTNAAPAAASKIIFDGYLGTVFSNAPSGTVGNAITFVDRMTIAPNGNVGIGTTSPSKKLTVVGGILCDTITVNNSIVMPTRYDDMDPFNLSAAKSVGATGFPPLVSTGNGFSQYQIGINDSAQAIIEQGHKFIEGDTDHIHVHYLTAVKDAGAAYVNWSIHYLARNVNDTITYTGTVTKQDTIPANTPALTHRMFEIAEISMPNIKIGSMRTICIKRIAASPATNPSVSPYILQVGIHRKVNSIGSGTETTK